MFSSIDINSQGLALYDLPLNPFDGTGVLLDANTLIPSGTINYITGAFNITFAVAPGAGQPINSQSVPYQPSLPQAMLYYNNKFTLRPVPDQPYRITFEAYQAPSDLLSSTAVPELAEWWQLIAVMSAKKILEDRLDMDTVQLLLPLCREQLLLCNRRTLVQYANERPASIYTEQIGAGNGYSGWGGGNF